MLEAIGPTLVCTALTEQRRRCGAAARRRPHRSPEHRPGADDAAQLAAAARRATSSTSCSARGRSRPLTARAGDRVASGPGRLDGWMSILSSPRAPPGCTAAAARATTRWRSELLRARPRGHAAAALHADHRRANVSRKRVLFGGISVYLQQYSSLFRTAPRLLDRLWDSPRGHQRVRQPIGLDRSEPARRPDDLDARGTQRRPAQGVRQAARVDSRTNRCPTSSTCPTRCSSRWPAPLRRALKRPVCCTLQGEDLFLNGLLSALSRAGDRADPRSRCRTSIASSSVSDYCVAIMSKMLRDSGGAHVGRAARHQPERVRAARPQAAEQRSVPRRLLRARRSREGAARAGRRLHRAAPPRRHARRCGSTRRATWSRRRRRISTASSGTCEGAGLGGEFTYHGAVDRARQARVPARPWTCCRCRRPTTSRRGCSCWKRWRAACRSSSRGAARSPRWSRRPAAACSSPPDDPHGLADALLRAVAGPRAARALGARGFDGVREHYSIAAVDRSAARGLSATLAERERGARSRWPDAVLSVTISPRIPTPRGPLTVLSDVSFSLAPGDAAAIMGPSGSGKSSLLYILGGLEPPTSGTVTLDGRESVPADARAARGVPQPGDRLRLPGSLPAAAVHGARERAGADAGGGPRDAGDAATSPRGARVDRAGRSRRSHRSSARRAVGRRAAARRDRPRADPPAAAAALRRADRQPRSRLGGDRRRAAARSAPRQQNILVVVTHSAALAERFPMRFEMSGGRLTRTGACEEPDARGP